MEYARGEAVFSQGDACEHVMYIHTGGVKLSVRSKTGREVIVALLGPADFFGEGCLAGQPIRTGSATAITLSTILLIDKRKMVRLLHRQHAMSDRFIAHMLARNLRLEEDLLDQFLTSTEKRLARMLLLAARYGQQGRPRRVIAKISMDQLAEAVGTTRSRAKILLNKFRKLGFVEGNGRFTIRPSLLSVLLQD